MGSGGGPILNNPFVGGMFDAFQRRDEGRAKQQQIDLEDEAKRRRQQEERDAQAAAVSMSRPKSPMRSRTLLSGGLGTLDLPFNPKKSLLGN